jgi:hypothetical protein
MVRKTPEEKAKKIADNREEKQASREQKTAELQKRMEGEYGKMLMMETYDDTFELPRHGYDPTKEPIPNIPGRKVRKKMTPEEQIKQREFEADAQMWLWDAELAMEDESEIQAEMNTARTRRERNTEFLDMTAQLEGFKIVRYGATDFYDWYERDAALKEATSIEHIKKGKKTREVNFLPTDIAPFNPKSLREKYDRYVKENAPYDVPDPVETEKQAKARAKEEADAKAKAQVEIDKAFLEEMRALEKKQLKNQPPLPPMPRPKTPPPPPAPAPAPAPPKAKAKAKKEPTEKQKAKAKADADKEKDKADYEKYKGKLPANAKPLSFKSWKNNRDQGVYM